MNGNTKETLVALLLAVVGLLSILAGPGDLCADPEPALSDTTVTDSLAALDSLPAVPAPPDSQWAVHFVDVESLTEAYAQYDSLVAQNQPVFVRVRADWTRYRYQILAGPWFSRREADSAATALTAAGLAVFTNVKCDTTGGLLAGLVLEPAQSRPAVLTDPTGSLADSAAVAGESGAVAADSLRTE